MLTKMYFQNKLTKLHSMLSIIKENNKKMHIETFTYGTRKYVVLKKM